MRHWLAHLLLPTMLALVATPACAQVETQTSYVERIPSQKQVLGGQHRDTVARAVRATKRGDRKEALGVVQPVTAYCDALLDSGHALVSVADEAEYTDYVAAAGNGEPVDWVDMACPQAYQLHAFIAVEEKRFEEALALLEKTTRLAPYWSEPLTERGFLLNQTGKPADGLDSYRAALALSRKHADNKLAIALALRGIGYSHVELGDLDAGEQAYRESLEVEPGNALAERELDYIREQREKKATKP
jgi:tetratricopeptide (TPR) repeat protein